MGIRMVQLDPVDGTRLLLVPATSIIAVQAVLAQDEDKGWGAAEVKVSGIENGALGWFVVHDDVAWILAQMGATTLTIGEDGEFETVTYR